MIPELDRTLTPAQRRAMGIVRRVLYEGCSIYDIAEEIQAAVDEAMRPLLAATADICYLHAPSCAWSRRAESRHAEAKSSLLEWAVCDCWVSRVRAAIEAAKEKV